MTALHELPAGYHAVRSLDLSKDRAMLVALNLVGLVLFFFFGWLFIRLALLLRPEFAGFELSMTSVWGLVAILFVYAAVLVLHELVHGLFFWWATRARPHFGFKGFYAFAAAPDWYIPRNSYLVIGLSPLVLITAAGVALIPLIPREAMIPLLFALTANAAGAVGDLATVSLVLSYPPATVVRDHGDAFTIYQVSDP